MEEEIEDAEIEIAVSHVDGVSEFLTSSNRASEILKFLEKYDHEGSSIALTIRANDEDAYSILRALIHWNTCELIN